MMKKTRLMLAGDSISLDYGRTLSAFLPAGYEMLDREGVAEAYRNLDEPIGGNCGDSRRVLALARELCEKKLNFDVFLFNCGLHDVKLNAPERRCQVPLDEYIDNLTAVIRLIKERGAIPVFMTTTPADRSRYADDAKFWRKNEDVIAYNSAAVRIAESEEIKVIDLFAFTLSTGLSGDMLYRDHTHFTPEVIRLQAAFIAGNLAMMGQPRLF